MTIYGLHLDWKIHILGMKTLNYSTLMYLKLGNKKAIRSAGGKRQ
jgi:hypothetical protein